MYETGGQTTAITAEDIPTVTECEQRNLHNKFCNKTTVSTSGTVVKHADDAAKAVKSENVPLDLLFCGLSGCKKDRARQILRKVNTSEHFQSTINPDKYTYLIAIRE